MTGGQLVLIGMFDVGLGVVIRPSCIGARGNRENGRGTEY